MKFRLFILLQALVVVVFAQSGKDQIKLTDMLRIKQASNIQLSVDGKTAFFTLTSIEPETDKKWEYQFQSQLWAVNTDGLSSPRQLTSSKEGSAQFALSPDSRQIVFIRNIDSKPQLFLLAMNGGEAFQLTRSKYGVSSPRWSPDGKQIVYLDNIPWKNLANDSLLNAAHSLPGWSAERPGLTDNSFLNNSKQDPNPDGSINEARAWLQQNEKDKKAKVINRLQFQEESVTNGDLSVSQVFLITASPGAIPRQLTTGFNSYSNPQFISDTQIMVNGEADESVHPDRNLAMGIYTLQTDGSGLKPFLVKKDYNYIGAAVSASGKWIAVQHGPVSYLSIPALAILPTGGTEKDLITIPADRDKGNVSWKGDEQVYATTASNGGTVLIQYDLKTKKVQTMGTPNEGIGSFSIAGNTMAYVKTTISNPFEIYTADQYAKSEKRITGFNEDWLKTKLLVQPEKNSFVNEKGQSIEYWVMKPGGYATGKKYPLLLEIHGGPTAMWGPGESTMWHEFQFWCAKGYGVVYCNPRGSGGYGNDLLKSNVNDWGNGPMGDVLTALDKAVAQGWADTSRLFVTGGSYAGYLVAYILGHDKRFKAACSQRGVYDLRTFFGEGNAWRLVPNYFGGYPWEKPTKDILERESPISYVQNIFTPLIIFHGENDLRTGVISSEQLYKSLKVLGRPVEYVRHPGATHEITRSGNNRQRMDQMLRTWEFFERFR
ncbi:S9 family peptidase [Flavihumibacter fluvii]|uniref:S9 family peptidase n=1 Tax=Flavihumibacter fluvii TaxID=2838157 RepID=UPI001BDEDB45|nr:S9 family peptidase [Flavihumibacter fluvii]ULQ51551.1 S9 family peptidase [Flavihumibacter fluvii]